MVQRHNEADRRRKNPHRTYWEHIQAEYHHSDGEGFWKIFLQSFQPFRERNQPSCASNRYACLSLKNKQKHLLICLNNAIFKLGAPSVPILTGSSSSTHLYSYDLVWEVSSEYQIKQHEAVFWPASQVSGTENISKKVERTITQILQINITISVSIVKMKVLFTLPLTNVLQRGCSQFDIHLISRMQHSIFPPRNRRVKEFHLFQNPKTTHTI